MNTPKIFLRYILPILAMATGLGLGYHYFYGREPLPAFDRAPITTIDGKTLTAKDLAGKVVLVNFWATSCASCVAEMPQLKKLYQDYRSKNFELLAVAMPYDQTALVSRFRETQALPFVVAHDAQNQWVPQFGKVTVTPTFMLYDSSGMKRYGWIGPMADDKLRQTIDSLING